MNGAVQSAIFAAMIVIVHGYDGSGPGHWQHWLHRELEGRGVPVAFPQFSAPVEPVADVWVAELDAVIERSAEPVRLVAHSLGVWAVDHLLSRKGAGPIEAALLVAPPSPWSLFEPIQSFLPPPRSREAWAPLRDASLLLGSDNDDLAGEEEFVELGERLGVECQILRGAGHINAAAGFGPFPLALEWSLGPHASAR